VPPPAAAPKFYVTRRATTEIFVAQPNSSQKCKFYQPVEYFSAQFWRSQKSDQLLHSKQR